MPEISPSFIQIKKWIIEAAPEYGVKMTVNRAKALAGRYLAEQDPELDDGRTEYADPTGTEAVRRWMDAMFTKLDTPTLHLSSVNSSDLGKSFEVAA